MSSYSGVVLFVEPYFRKGLFTKHPGMVDGTFPNVERSIKLGSRNLRTKILEVGFVVVT